MTILNCSRQTPRSVHIYALLHYCGKKLKSTHRTDVTVTFFDLGKIRDHGELLRIILWKNL